MAKTLDLIPGPGSLQVVHFSTVFTNYELEFGRNLINIMNLFNTFEFTLQCIKQRVHFLSDFKYDTNTPPVSESIYL